MKLFLLILSFLPMSSYSIDNVRDGSSQMELTCITVTVCSEKDGPCYLLEICGVEEKLQNYPRKLGGTMGDEKAMVISGFPSSANDNLIVIKPNTSLKLTKSSKTSSSFQSISVIAGKYKIKGGKTTLKLGGLRK